MNENNLSQKKRFIFLVSHPIQYFSPMFQLIAKQRNIDLLVLYCSDENINGHLDRGFGVNVKWDIPLLEGYNYKFIKNNSFKPSIFNGFWGLMNFEIIKILKNERNSFLVIHGWTYFTYILAIIIGKIFKLKICLRIENPLNQELLKSKMILFLRKIMLKYILFRFFDYFFYIGIENKKFYEHYGVKEEKLIFTPYSVDNDRFSFEFESYKNKKLKLRRNLGLPIEKKIILFSGKLIPKKRPLDLLKAFQLLNDPSLALVFLGDGELREVMKNYIRTNNLSNVYIVGFVNQSDIGKYYASADLFVLPSGYGETWGLVVNEALNFNLPIILSNMVGCSSDFADKEEMFECGNIFELKKLIENKVKYNNYKTNNREKIKNYSYQKIIESLLKL